MAGEATWHDINRNSRVYVSSNPNKDKTTKVDTVEVDTADIALHSVLVKQCDFKDHDCAPSRTILLDEPC